MTPSKEERLLAKHRRDFAALQRAERRMVMAFNRWAKLREVVRRNDKVADTAWYEHVAQVAGGGQHDVRDMARAAGLPVKDHKRGGK